MQIQINPLPVPTWNRMGVNEADHTFALPEVVTAGASRLELGHLPGSLQRAGHASPLYDDMESGMGPGFDRFVKDHCTASCYLTAQDVEPECIQLTRVLGASPGISAFRCGIHATSGSSLTLVDLCRAEKADACDDASLTQIYADVGSTVRLIQVQLLPDACRRWSAVSIHAEEGASVTLIRAELGAGASACGTRALLAGMGSALTLNTLYLGDGTRRLDFNDSAIHVGRDTVSELYAAGVLAGESQKTLRGTIDFRRGAVSASGHENEEVLLLDPRVRNQTAPLILCGEERVEGQHAASVGRLEDGVLYYLASRGIPADTARILLAEARFAPVLDKLPVKSLRAAIMSHVERRLSRYVG